MTKKLASLGFVAALAFAAVACNDTETGAEGLVLFTPDQCDLMGTGCDFDDGIAVGGIVNVWISGADQSVSTVGFDLESDDPNVFTVGPIGDVAGRPTWEIVGTGAGVARLYAVDADGSDVDFLEVAVQELEALRLVQTLGDAVGPTSDSEFDEIWQINANMETWFYIEPMVGLERIMGIMQYGIVIDEGLEAGLAEGSDVTGGFYKINVPAGDYTLEITADNGTFLNVLFQAQ